MLGKDDAMAKRKLARATGHKTAGTRAGASRPRSRVVRSARKKRVARNSAARRRAATRKAATRKPVRKAAARQAAARKPVRKGAALTGAARKVAQEGATRKRTAKKATRETVTNAAVLKATVRQSPARGARAATSGARPAAQAARSARKAPALDRERRTFREDDIVASPPSSLDLDRSASSARSGRRELVERFHHHTETSPALTGGDVDADWEGAYATGDEAPGGDNPTPDQDIVDDIGKALGVQYEDNEELKGEKKISDRDKKRWELDPASAEDYEDR